MKITRLLLTVFIIIIIMNRVCAAENKDYVSSYLCELGEKLYKQGYVVEAVKYFRQALIVNPYNSTAKIYLERILVQQGWVQENKPSEIKKEESDKFRDHVSQLQEEVRSYQKQLEDIKKELQSKDSQIQKITGELKLEKDRASKENKNQKKDYESLLKANEEKLKSNDLKIKELTSEKESLIEENEKIEARQLAEIEKVMGIIGEALPSKRK